MKKQFVIIFILLFTVITGCASKQGEMTVKKTETPAVEDGQGKNVQQFSYEVPQSVQGVLVNQAGYTANGTKTVVFRGKALAETFEIIDSANKQVVYTGKITSVGYNEAYGEYTGYGSFSELKQKGTYYIQTAVIGESYPFVIGEDVYQNVFEQTCRVYFDAGEAGAKADGTAGGWQFLNWTGRSVGEGSSAAIILLLCFEGYSEFFTDNMGVSESGNHVPDILDEVRYEVEWLLNMQDEQTGGIHAGIWAGQQEPVSVEATAQAAGLLARFSQIYQAYDAAFSAKCLQAAQDAWKYLEKNETAIYVNELYFAAAELYKATAAGKYHVVVKKLALEAEDSNCFSFYGDFAYLTTKGTVDILICNKIMERWMKRVERAIESADSDVHFLAGKDSGEMLDNMLYLVMVDHIITSHEYNVIIENQLHYLLGRNNWGVSFVPETGYVHPADVAQSLSYRPEENAIFLFLLCEVLNEQSVK